MERKVVFTEEAIEGILKHQALRDGISEGNIKSLVENRCVVSIRMSSLSKICDVLDMDLKDVLEQIEVEVSEEGKKEDAIRDCDCASSFLGSLIRHFRSS